MSASRLRSVAIGDDVELCRWLTSSTVPHVAAAREAATRIFARLDGLGARVVALGDTDFPFGLRDLRDPPPFLTLLGKPPAIGGTAIVGSRTASTRAIRLATDLAKRATPPIVAGLARGIDAAAHWGALRGGVVTVAYVGNGLGATYPPEHEALQCEIVRAGGAVLSERLPDERATPSALVRRDRLQAAHAAACILIESEASGGAVHTLRFAARLGRPRFALEPRVDDVMTDGNALVIRAGATPLPWDPVRCAQHLTAAAASAEPAATEQCDEDARRPPIRR